MDTTATTPTRGDDLPAQLERLGREHPRLLDRLDQDLVAAWAEDLRRAAGGRDDFGPAAAGGRGERYVRAQQDRLMTRAHGIDQLLRLICDPAEQRGQVVLDLLGGDGLVRRVAGRTGHHGLSIMTCDLSPLMVEAAWEAGLPAVLQSASRLLFRSGSVDGVLLAYGTHHLPESDRLLAAEESLRVLRPGGVFVMHDFEVGGPMDVWFEQVVDRYSATGHRFAHFTREELTACLDKAGFEDVRVVELADPYRVVADSPRAAELGMGRYLLDMYGLVGLEDSLGAERAEEWTVQRAREVFGVPGPDGVRPVIEPRRDPGTGGWHHEVPRRALVAVGRRPER